MWLADITYIRIRSGFVYLAAILDAYSRRVIGYAISAGLETSLTIKALRMAVAARNLGPGVIHHSDQGVQYASEEYVDELRRHGFSYFIEEVYNRKRLHSALGYLSPVNFETPALISRNRE